MRNKLITPIALFIFIVGCVEPYDIGETMPPNMLVVEGYFSSQMKKHHIFLSRATSVGLNSVLREPGAIVTISSDDGETIFLSEQSPGIYTTDVIAAEPERIYTLHIKTSDGREYASAAVPFEDGPDIGDVRASYGQNPRGDGKGVQVSVDTQDPGNRGHYYRWNYTETYEVNAPYPANWIWLGGLDLVFRTDGIDTCYVSDTLRRVIIRDTHGLEQDKIDGLAVRYIPETEYSLRRRFSILVEQYTLSKDAYHFWDELRITSENQGSLADRQPGSLRGNMISLTNPEEKVLGFFEAGKVSEKRIFFSAINFFDQGMKMPKPLRANCLNLEPLVLGPNELDAKLPTLLQTMHIWEVAGLSPAIYVALFPKECCDCRDKGPTERPDFF
jgi:hypothetical protein